MNIGIVGTRGIPANYGGFETFAEELAVRLVKENMNVEVFGEKTSLFNSNYKGVKLSYLPFRKSDYPLTYYFLSLFRALRTNDIIIITGSPGANFFFLKYLFFPKKKTLIINPDGLEFLRAKWSFSKRLFLKISNHFASRYSDYLIADSQGVKDHLISAHKNINPNKILKIEYGAIINENSLNLKSDYYLVVARLEPENNIKMIIEGFIKSGSHRKLYIVGNLMESEYVNSLLQFKSTSVIFMNGIYDKEKLTTLRNNCFAYLHGHSVGGTNPSLLEAMAAGNITICNDNIFNREVTDNKMFYFDSGSKLAELIKNLEETKCDNLISLSYDNKKRIKEYYNWERICNEYVNLFKRI